MSDHLHPEDSSTDQDPAPLDPAVLARLEVDPLDQVTRRRLRAAALDAFDAAGPQAGAASSPAAGPEPRPAGGAPDELAARRARRRLLWLAPAAAAVAALAVVVAVRSGGDGGEAPVAAGGTSQTVPAGSRSGIEIGALPELAGDGRSAGSEQTTEPTDAPKTTDPSGSAAGDGPAERERFARALPDLGEVSDPDDLQDAIDEVVPSVQDEGPGPSTNTSTGQTPPTTQTQPTGVGVQEVPPEPACLEQLGTAVILLQAQGTFDDQPVVVYVIADLEAEPSAQYTPAIAVTLALDDCEILERTSVKVAR